MEQNYRTASVFAFANVILTVAAVVVLTSNRIYMMLTGPITLLKAGIMVFLYFSLYKLFDELYGMRRFSLSVKITGGVLCISVLILAVWNILYFIPGQDVVYRYFLSAGDFGQTILDILGIFSTVMGHGVLTFPLFSVLMIFLSLRLLFALYRQFDKRFLLLVIGIFLWSVLSLKFFSTIYTVVPELVSYILMGIIFGKPVQEVEFV